MNREEKILEDFRTGRIDRRSALQGLAACFATALAGGRAAASGTDEFTAVGLNHLALRVTDVARSRDFYVKHFGLDVRSDDAPYNAFLGCGDHFVALFSSKTAGMDHFCFTIDDYEPAGALRRLQAMGLEAHRVQNRVYFKDPDGLEGQLAAP